jgi:hypothetical protein
MDLFMAVFLLFNVPVPAPDDGSVIVIIVVVPATTNQKSNGDVLEPEFYSTDPDCGLDLDIPFDWNLNRISVH